MTEEQTGLSVPLRELEPNGASRPGLGARLSGPRDQLSRLVLLDSHDRVELLLEREADEVAFLFTQEDGATRVDLEHRGFESLGPKADEAFNSYNDGWVGVLGFYEKHVV
jgi:hypothetical protein